jgi:hypothetical protein
MVSPLAADDATRIPSHRSRLVLLASSLLPTLLLPLEQLVSVACLAVIGVSNL